MLAITLRPLVRPAPVLAIATIAYLHWRFDLSALGIRTRGWQGDTVAILLIGALSFLAALFQPPAHSLAPGSALSSGLDRLIANPASTVENLFYFGFLTERLAAKTGWWTPLLIGLMYTIHEMTNPEYWYEDMAFVFTFVAVTAAAALYLWRRSVLVIWLSDGVSRLIMRLL
jgi:membrane protease YdiL (CAAX protease family)